MASLYGPLLTRSSYSLTPFLVAACISVYFSVKDSYAWRLITLLNQEKTIPSGSRWRIGAQRTRTEGLEEYVVLL